MARKSPKSKRPLCKRCQGSGRLQRTRPIAYGMFTEVQRFECPDCRGTGRMTHDDLRRIEREAIRARDIQFAARLGRVSRHVEDPEGSQRWVDTGKW